MYRRVSNVLWIKNCIAAGGHPLHVHQRAAGGCHGRQHESKLCLRQSIRIYLKNRFAVFIADLLINFFLVLLKSIQLFGYPAASVE